MLARDKSSFLLIYENPIWCNIKIFLYVLIKSAKWISIISPPDSYKTEFGKAKDIKERFGHLAKYPSFRKNASFVSGLFKLWCT